MDILLLLVRLVLAGVLAVAGITKVLDLSGSRQAMRDFGVPTVLAAPLGLLLPLAELLIALALLPAATAWAGATAALLLLLLFIGGIALNLVRGRTPECHCFGQLHSQPISSKTIMRNGLLSLLAAVVVIQGPDGAGIGLISWISTWTLTTMLLVVGGLLVAGIMALQSWALLNLLRQNGRLLLRLEKLEAHVGLSDPGAALAQNNQPSAAKGLPVGTPAPDFDLPALDGTHHSLATLLAAGKPLLLIFSSVTCAPCNELMGEIAGWQQKYAAQLTIAVVNRGSAEAVRAKTGALNPATILLQAEGETAATYQVSGTPSAVLVSTDGRIRTSLAGGATAIRELVHTASQPLARMAEQLLPRTPIVVEPRPLRAKAHGASLVIGSAAPAFALPDLRGEQVELAQFRGKSTLILFWNPTCGFCRRMLSELQQWEVEHHPAAPQLLLISSGTAAANQAQALSAPILLDENFQTGHAYGAKGTPSAILIDAHGKVASELVVGAPSIWPLLAGSGVVESTLGAQPLAA